MRSEQEMFDLILGFAMQDDRVRVVGMEGSRTNPNIVKDKFQDYDISFLVKDMQSFLDNHSWVDVFGQRTIMQMPEVMSLFPPTLRGWFSYLMLFDDGNRIDLKLIPLEEKDIYINSGDGLLQILLDKDDLIGQLPVSTDAYYHVKPPTKEFYADCCNEFLWVTTYVAKGLWRKEILFASHHLNETIRPCLLQMIGWKVGIQTEFIVSVGKDYKYLKKYISEESWNKLLETYNQSSYECCWDSLYQMVELFKEVASFVGDELGFAFPSKDADEIVEYLNKVHLDSFKSL